MVAPGLGQARQALAAGRHSRGRPEQSHGCAGSVPAGEYAIHGTTAAMRRSIGSAASYGCIRMLNEDIIDLFERVSVGTRVTVTR